LESISIPSSVREIKKFAFQYSGIKSIDLPASTKLGEGAFRNSAISELKLPNKLKEIPKSMCYQCKTLTSIKIPNSVRRIGETAFVGTSLKKLSIGKLVEWIGERALSINGLKKVVFKGSTEGFEGNIFTYGDLEEVTFDWRRIKHGMFADLENLSTVNVGKRLQSIGRGAFSLTDSLKTINLPKSVLTINESAFAGSGLIKFKIPPKVDEIKKETFYLCRNLEKVDFNYKLTSIKDSAFYHTDMLKSVVLPENLKTIGRDAFRWSGLSGHLRIPKNVERIGSGAFRGTKLSSISLPIGGIKYLDIPRNAFPRKVEISYYKPGDKNDETGNNEDTVEANVNETSTGTNRDDNLIGTKVDDILTGKKGNDVIRGDQGDDVISGGMGRDDLYGGKGEDMFVITRKSSIGENNIDFIHDYEKGEKIRFEGFEGGTGKFSVYLEGKDTVIDYRGDAVGIIRDFQHNKWYFSDITADYMHIIFLKPL